MHPDVDIDELYEQLFASEFPFRSLEELLTSTLGFGLTTATPVQIAICRILSGAPLAELATHPDVLEALGGYQGELTAPKEVIVCAAVRSAKSLIAAALAVWASQSVDLGPSTSAGEMARFSIASIEKDNAAIIVQHLLGALARPGLGGIYISHEEYRADKSIKESGGESLTHSFLLRHPSGRPVEIRVVAGKRAGGSLVSRWSLGCVLDEAPRMVGGSDGVVNFDDMRSAVLSRLLPGARLFAIGSPWARSGPVYDLVMAEWGSPTNGRTIIKARGPAMNPLWWTPERCDWMRENDPDGYQTDVLAEFLDVAEALYTDALLSSVTRVAPESLECRPGLDYIAFMDAGVSRNSWTFAITCKDVEVYDDGRWRHVRRVAYYQEWTGTKTQRNQPGAILTEIAAVLERYGIGSCWADQWGYDGFAALADERGFNLLLDDAKPREKVQGYLDLARDMHEGAVELSPHKQVRKDLVLVKKIRKGGINDVSILLPETPDGRHCDAAPSIVGSLSKHHSAPVEAPPPEGSVDRINWDAQRRQELASEKLEIKSDELEWFFEEE